MKMRIKKCLFIAVFALVAIVIVCGGLIGGSDKNIGSSEYSNQYVVNVKELKKKICTNENVNDVLTSEDIVQIIHLIEDSNECAIDLAVRIYISSAKEGKSDLAEEMALSIGKIYPAKPDLVLKSLINNGISNDKILGGMLMDMGPFGDECSAMISELQKRYEATKKVNDNDLLEIKDRVLCLLRKKIDLYKRECR